MAEAKSITVALRFSISFRTLRVLPQTQKRMVSQNTFWLKYSQIVVALVYAVLFVLISLFVFYENDESQPIAEIFQWGYLLPVAIYSGFSLWVSFGLFLLLRKIFNRIISFSVSLLIGIPAGLIILDKILRLVF